MVKVHFYSLRIIVLLLCSLCVSSASAQKKNTKSNKNKIERIDTVYITKLAPQKMPVVPFRDTIFYIYGNMGSFTAQQRAIAIERRIRVLEEDPTFEEDSLKLIDYSGYLNVVYKGEILVSVDTLQAELSGQSRRAIATAYKEQIINSIDQQREETSWQRIAFQVIGVLAVVVIVFFLLKLIVFVFRRLKIYVRLQREKRLRGLFGIIDSQREVYLLIGLLKFIQFLLVIILLYSGILVLFKLFPNTKGISDQLIDYVVYPLKTIGRSVRDYMPKLFTIIVIVVIFRYIKKFLRSIAGKIAENKIVIKGFYPDWALPTYNIISVILFIFMFILIFPYLPKSDSHVFQGVSVFAGIMLSLGSTSIIGNLVAGLVITYMRPFKIGDRIKMGDSIGNVIEKTALVTRIKTPKNEVITIPNSNVMSAQTINYSFSAKEYGLILYTTVTIGYDVPWSKVNTLLLDVAKRTDNLSKKQKPFILQDALGDYYVEYQLNVYIKDANLMNKVYSDLRQNAQDVFAEAGIELMSPHYRVNRNVDGTDTTIPREYNKDKVEKESK